MRQSSMLRRDVLGACALVVAMPVAASADPVSEALAWLGGEPLDQETAARGLNAALRAGVAAATARLGKLDGYFGDPAVRIPLPRTLEDTKRAVAPISGTKPFDDLQKRLNRGAEKAAPKARDLLLRALDAMTIEDAVLIVRGPEDSATRFFEQRTTPALRQTFRPIVARELEGSGALRAAARLDERLSALPAPLRPQNKVGDGLIDHGVSWGLKGLFHYIGEEEAAIRRDPVKRTSDILKRVFGG